MGLNRLEILGRIGRIDALRRTNSDKDVLGFSVAVNERKDSDTVWFKVAVFGNRAPALERILRVGELVYCAGPVSVDTWEDRDGKTRADLRLVAFDVELCGGGKGERQERTEARRPPGDELPPDSGGGDDFGDDNIPF